MIKMGRFSLVYMTFVISFVHRTHEFGFNPLTFVKNWSLKGSASFPMPTDFLDTILDFVMYADYHSDFPCHYDVVHVRYGAYKYLPRTINFKTRYLKDSSITNRLISKEGYGWQQVPVETRDGYLLQVTRILPRAQFTGKRPPVMLVHGLLSTSETWVSRGRFQDLAFLLTELGFDVWLPDLRGNHYGKQHKYLSPKNPRFWDFSFHEIGVYDIPAFMDVILDKTGASQVAYIGHSMGTTAFFVMASLRPEYNKKISAAVLLAPVASKFPFDEIVNPAFRVFLTQFNVLFETLKSAGIYEILPRTPRLVYNVKKYCTRQPEQDYCFDLIGSLYGEHRANLDRKHFGEQVSYLPSGASLRTVHHFAQVFNYGFHMYDYGMKVNKLKYNSTIPPAYPLQRITAPSMLIYGNNDLLTSEQGVAFLRDMVPGVNKVVAAPDYKFTHLDFIYGVNTNDTIHPFIVDFLMERVKK